MISARQPCRPAAIWTAAVISAASARHAASVSPRTSSQASTREALTSIEQAGRQALVEARRLMMTKAANVETAAFEVGYESPSQFSREYTRLFGAPPVRDALRLRSEGITLAEIASAA